MSDPVYKQYPTLYARFQHQDPKTYAQKWPRLQKSICCQSRTFCGVCDNVPNENRVSTTCRKQPRTCCKHNPEPADDQTVAKQRELIQQLIRQEIKQNSKPYEGKSSAELD